MKKKLFKSLIVTCTLLVTFFSIVNKSYAASFKYSDFKWEEFLEQNKQYWITSCDEGDTKCHDRILKTQEKFYKRLYKLLTKYQNKGYTLDDDIIIATVFYGLTPNTFGYSDEVQEKAYKLDEEDEEKYIAKIIKLEIKAAKEYFEEEKDSLKTLMNNMIGYTQPCYGISNEVPTKNQSGEDVCSGTLIPYENYCVDKIQSLSSTFFDSIGLGKKNNDEECKALAKNYSSYTLGDISAEPVIDLDLYWSFLIKDKYFDNKDHLQSYFKHVLEMTDHKKMTELSKDEYEKYEKDIEKCRTRIVNGIKSVVKTNDRTAAKTSMYSGSNSTYWWPIGGSETSTIDGITVATGEPESINITSPYGYRNHPVTKKYTLHSGIDIAGIDGVTNVIAVRDGTVVDITDNNGGECVNGNSDCGGTYGNYVVIQHVDNNYTLYAHMATNSLTVKSGDVVKQGQVIGKIGNTGRSTGGHLHFEVRVGGNDYNSAEDPMLFINSDNPRATGVQSDLMEWIGAMEGTGPTEGDNYVVYNDSGGVATFGHGITVVNNKSLISSFGINPNSLTAGSLVPKSKADEMYATLIQAKMDNIKSLVSSKGLTLADNQIAALISLQYNVGNINSFFKPYESYGSTESLCSNWWENYALHDAAGNYLEGLKKRRISECNAFVNGVYNNPY